MSGVHADIVSIALVPTRRRVAHVRAIPRVGPQSQVDSERDRCFFDNENQYKWVLPSAVLLQDPQSSTVSTLLSLDFPRLDLHCSSDSFHLRLHGV